MLPLATSIPTWYRDPISCLQSTVASVLLHRGLDPLPVLGTGWGFCEVPGQTTTEEFSYPAPDGDLGAALAPHHDLDITWHRTPPADGLAPVMAALAAGELPILAVDNYYLPFRPAFHDVHAAHLIVVGGIDGDRGQACVSDAMPPAFQGEITTADLLASWGSANPRDVQDDFFSAAPIEHRRLAVDTAGVTDELSPSWLGATLRGNVAAMDGGTTGAVRSGLVGLDDWIAEIVDRAHAGDATTMAETYVLGWGLQAQSALHGELLRRCGVAWGRPDLREAGRAVEHVAHLWSGVRVTAAHGRTDPAAAAADLAHHAGRLRHSYLEARSATARAAGDL